MWKGCFLAFALLLVEAYCQCEIGYEQDPINLECIDIDECVVLEGNGGCLQICVNIDGSFMCACNDGYILDINDGMNCLDIDECELNNGGCLQNCMNTDGSFMCSCDDGYILDIDDGMNCLDIDECELNNGGCWHNCTNTDGSFMCSCNDGYILDDIDKMSCLDHDECANNADNCEQVCNNHVGGFVCSCYLGCELSNDMTSCLDIDECLDSDCDQICINLGCTDGRYNCSCNDGYKLGKDEHACIDVDECELGIDNCDQTCINTVGSYECDCQSGCFLNSNNFTCDDIDECLQDVCSQNCNNTFCTEGKYTCSCDLGYELGVDEHTCFDKDECELGLCNQTCTNMDGSFSCGCDTGCMLGSDLTSCIDIDECSEGTAMCEQLCSNTYCTNGIGYTCSCNDGYTLDTNGYSCSDINECMGDDDHGCEQSCTNTDGSFECECSSGCRLNGDGKTCSDVNECTLGLDTCEQTCTNDICSRNNQDFDYTCSCDEGYNLNTSNLMTCEDINECATSNGGCTQVCNNTIGSFSCSCNGGYELDQDGFKCNGLSCTDELQAPLYGTILCTGDSNTDDVCTYSCNQGFYLEGNEQRTCQSNAEWTGVEPQCLKFTCPELEIESSLLLEQCENTVFSVCTVACKEESYVDGVELYFTQTCTIDAEDNTYWVNDNKTCQANSNVCDPNPCQNGGTCQKNTNEDVPCVCGPYSTGLYCETTLLVAPDIPILMVNQESETFSLFTQSHNYTTISITTDPSIEVYPSNTIDLSPWDTEVHFSLKPTVEGFFEIEFFVFGITTEQFELPVITHLIVEDTSVTVSILDDYNITDSVLLPGCCVTSEPVQSTYCTAPGQEMRLSSSCGWRDGYATNGITFLHSGDIALPISIIGSDTFSSSTSTCDQCEYDRSETCLSSSATPTDVIEMLKQKSLLNTFLYNIKQVLPSSVTIDSSGTLDANYATADEYSYAASITSPETLAWIDSCENLGIGADDLVYAIRTNSGMSIYIRDQRFTTDDFTESVCFAIDPCRLPQSPLFMSIPQSIKDSVIQTIHSSYGLPNDIVQDVSSLSLSSFGVLSFPGVDRFWNGSSMVNFETSKTFDIGVGLTAGLGEVGSSRINFTGMTYGKLDETISVWLTGSFAVDIYPLLNGRIDSLYLSADDNGLFITEQANNSEFQSGASMKLIYDPDSNSGMLTDYIQSTEACLVQTYVNTDEVHNPYYFSLRSQCLILKTLGLNFPDLTTTIVIPTVDDYWPANPQLAIRALGWNLNSKPTDLGSHVSIPVSLDNAYALQLDVYANHSYSAILKEASLKLLNRVLLVDIQFWDSDLSFSTSMEFYNRYQAWIMGSSSFLSSSWDDIVIAVNGKFMDSLQTDLDGTVREFLNYQGQKYNDRVSIAEASINSSAIVMNEYEREVEDLTNQLNVLTEDVQKLELKYQSALNYINQNNSLLQTILLSAQDIDQDDLNAVLTQCDILDCTNGDCQFGLVPTTCDTNINNLLIEINEQTDYVSLAKQDIETDILFSCSQQSNCQNYNGIRWLSREASIPSPVVDSETALPYSYSSLYCQGVCQTEKSTSFVARNNKYVDAVTRSTIQTENISNQLTQVCFMNDTCEARFLDEPCMTINYDCQDRKLADAISLAVQASLFAAMVSLHDAYTSSVKLAINTRVALDDKVFDMEMTKRKLDMATSAHTSSIENHQRALNVLTELEKDASTIVNSLVSSHTDSDIFSINSITFTLELNSNSSNTLPLMINYNIPFMGESFTIPLELDETVPLHITLEMFTRSIVDDLLLNIDSNYATKYGPENVENLFETNCLIMDEVYMLVNHFDDSLLDVENNYKYSNLTLVADLQRLRDRAEAIIFTSSAANVSDGFKNTLTTTLYNYNARVEAEYLLLEGIINKFLYTHWLDVTDAYSVASVAIGDNNCNSFIDCLKLSIDLMTPLVLNDPTIADAQEQLHTSLTNLQELSELTSANVREYISPFLSLLHITKESNYWCASKPNITEHPTPEVYWRIDSTGTLSCEASSEIPVAYVWWKDGYVVPNIKTAWLVIENIQYSDLGVYTCEAYNDVGSSYSLPSTVREHILPNILTVPDKSQVTYIRNEGGVQLTCEGESDYQYNYHWSWLFKAEGESDYKEIHNESNALFIESPAATDEGYYQCVIVSPFGSSTSDYAKLTVADPVVARIYYPMVIILWDSPSEESPNTSKLHHLISDDEAFIELLRNYLKLLAGQNSEISIEDISVNSHDDGYLEVTFALSSKNFTSQKIADQGLSDVLPEIRSIISSLEQGLVEITDNINSAEPFEYGNSVYTVVNTSLIVFTKHFDCPSGYQLDETLLVCVSCAQGEYGGVTEVLYRSESHNVYYPVVASTCMKCPRGYYQGDTGAVQCTQCPEYYTTVDNGAISVEECEALCQPDTYSEDGIQDCRTCSDRSYQPLYGARKCISCIDVPSDSTRCPLTSVSPTIGQVTDTTTLIIATAVTGSIVIICFVLLTVLILSIGIRKIRQKRVRNEGLDNVPPFSTVSAFEGSSVRRGMPIPEPKGNDLKIHNPIYLGEVDAMPLQQLDTVEQKSLHGQEDKTQVTFLDDVDDKSIGEANMSIDDTELLLPPELQGRLDEEKVEDVKYESVGAANMAFEIDLDDFIPQDNEDPISEDQRIANEVVKSAIQSAVHGDNVNDTTPLMAAEEDVSEDEDMLKNEQLTKELEDELATQLPQQLNTTSSQAEEEEEVGGLETIMEEPSTSFQIPTDPTSMPISDDKEDAIGSLVVIEQVEDAVVSGEEDTSMVVPNTNDVEVDDREMPMEEKIHTVSDDIEGNVNESATPNEDKQEEEKAGEEMEKVDTTPEPIIDGSTADDPKVLEIYSVIRTAAIEESSSEDEEQQQVEQVEQESKEKTEDKPQIDEDKTSGEEESKERTEDKPQIDEAKTSGEQELVDLETVIDMGEDETTVTDHLQIPSEEDVYASDTIKGKVEVDEEHEVSADYLLEDKNGKDKKLSEIIADISTDNLEEENDNDEDSYTVI